MSWQAIVGAAALVMLQLIYFSYKFGRLSQKVDDLVDNHLRHIESRLGRLEEELMDLRSFFKVS